jgi:ADP-ribosyl-[dinitrogen reductase] hydrolase
MQDLTDRIVGVLLGLAAGDRIGGPVRMALRVAESLRDYNGFDVSDIGKRYLNWWREGAFDTGPTVAAVLSLVASGATFEQASILVNERAGGKTAGCNPAHRCAPLAMCASVKDSELGRTAVTEARLTHRHPLAGEVAAAVACLCRALIRDTWWPVALRNAAEDRSPETRRALEIQPSKEISRSGFAPEVLSAAVHFLNTSDSLSTALARSIDFAGQANYCPVLVGSIGGARWGRTQIDERFLLHQGDLVPRLVGVGVDLAKGLLRIR